MIVSEGGDFVIRNSVENMKEHNSSAFTVDPKEKANKNMLKLGVSI